MSHADLSLSCDTSLLLIVDVQERLSAAMQPDAMQRVERSVVTLLRGAALLDVPIVCTEQYPKGLGPTLPAIVEALPASATRLEKTTFSCSTTVADVLEGSGRSRIVICGMESHVCVYQTVRDLAGLGYVLHVAADGVISRTSENRSIGLELMARSGALITCVETVLFDWMGGSHHPMFKEISKLVK